MFFLNFVFKIKKEAKQQRYKDRIIAVLDVLYVTLNLYSTKPKQCGLG